MAERKVLLSICIPTYNRAAVLNDTLSLITSDPAFDDEVEIVVSDNHSTDNTEEIVRGFMEKHPNVRYFCNDKNLIDLNFMIALSYGQGEYVKLLNDYIYFPEGMLGQMKERIREHVEDRTPLFFLLKVKREFKHETQLYCRNLDDYIRYVSYFTTWISNFGCWREAFQTMENKDKYLSYSLLQVDWTYHIISSSSKGAIIYHGCYYTTSKIPLEGRGGYNYFGVLVDKYYRIMLDYVNAGKASKSIYDKDRAHMLWHFKGRFINILLLRKKKYQYDLSGSFGILWHYFKVFPLFYVYIVFYILFSILIFLINIITWPFRSAAEKRQRKRKA